LPDKDANDGGINIRLFKVIKARKQCTRIRSSHKDLNGAIKHKKIYPKGYNRFRKPQNICKKNP
jgi:hypothetical protein